MVFLPKKPDGVRVSGLTSGIYNWIPPSSEEVILFFTVNVSLPIVANLFSDWLYDRIQNHKAKRIRINGKEPTDRADFDRIVREEIEIGKND